MQEARNIGKEMDWEAAPRSEIRESSLLKRVALWGVFLLLGFLLGFVPVWLSARESARQRDAAQANLRVSQLQNRLATAAMYSRSGDYEAARLATSDFFTDLRAEVNRQESGFTTKQREAVQPILSERDDVITLLARSDGAATERLTDLYLAYVAAVNPPAQKTP
jgi:hypothetical protein